MYYKLSEVNNIKFLNKEVWGDFDQSTENEEGYWTESLFFKSQIIDYLYKPELSVSSNLKIVSKTFLCL